MLNTISSNILSAATQLLFNLFLKNFTLKMKRNRKGREGKVEATSEIHFVLNSREMISILMFMYFQEKIILLYVHSVQHNSWSNWVIAIIGE